MIHLFDDFLDADVYESFRSHIETNVRFDGATNPIDGVTYPGISVDIPEDVKRAVMKAIKPKEHFLFMRLSLAGVPVPHQAHTDSTMGKYSLMLYLNRPEHCQGGTSLVLHKKTGLMTDPRDQFEQRIWELDTNKRSAWEAYDQIDMKSNRMAVFPANLMHRAEPTGGFGTDARDGRLVLTMFFS